MEHSQSLDFTISTLAILLSVVVFFGLNAGLFTFLKLCGLKTGQAIGCCVAICLVLLIGFIGIFTVRTVQMEQVVVRQEIENSQRLEQENISELHETALKELETRLNDMKQREADEESDQETIDTEIKRLENLKEKIQQAQDKQLKRPSWLRSAEAGELTEVTTSAGQAFQMGSHLLVASSGRWVTEEEAVNEADTIARELIAQQIQQEYENPLFGPPAEIEVTDDQLTNFIADKELEVDEIQLQDGTIQANMHRCHYLLNLSPDQLAVLTPSLRDQILESRLLLIGGGLLGFMLLSGLISLILRQTESRHQDVMKQ